MISAQIQSIQTEEITSYVTQSGSESASEGVGNKVCQAHQEEWSKGSGVSDLIIQENVQTLVDPKEIAKRLGWKAYKHTPGWWASGVDPASGDRKEDTHGQFKPDQPVQFPDAEKPAKYLSSKAPYDAICLSTGDPKFWPALLASPNIPIVITEGAKKAGAGLTNDIPTIALIGVEMGLRQGELVESLKPFAVPGRVFIFAFDSDIQIKPEVQGALKRLAKVLKKQDCIVKVATWKLEQGKGMDDFIVTNGADEFKERLQVAQAISTWEKQFGSGSFNNNNGKKQKEKPPGISQLAVKLVEKFKNKWAWNTKNKRWYVYEQEDEDEPVMQGVWSLEDNEIIGRMIQKELLKVTGLIYNLNVVNSVQGLMLQWLAVKRWNKQKELIPLMDGVLDLRTMTLKEHAPHYRFTWQLPYSWAERTNGCQLVKDWMLEAMNGDEKCVQLLRAYLKAIATRRTDLQRFLECQGFGGTGKGTYIRLAIALVGQKNTYTTKLAQLEQNRFEVAAIRDKVLLVASDAERYAGEVSTLKAITGQDDLRCEIKHKQQGDDSFTAECMVIVAANEPVQSSDYTSGLQRRRLTVPFNHQVESHQRRDLDNEFKPFLAGVLEWVLAMPDSEMVKLVRDTNQNVESLRQVQLNALLASNPIAEWFDHDVVLNPDGKTYVGIAKREKDHDIPNQYQKCTEWLYASYCEFTVASGNKPVSQRRFSDNLKDLVIGQLKLKTVTRRRDNKGAYFQGLVLRLEDDDSPCPITGIPSLTPNSDGSVTPSDGLVTSQVTGQTRTSDGSDGSRQTLFSFLKIISKNQEGEKNNCPLEGQSSNNPSPPPPASLTTLEQEVQPSQASVTPSQVSVTEESPELLSDPWVEEENLIYMAHSLESCPDRNTFADLIVCWPSYAMNAACELLSLEKQAQIKQWLMESSITGQNQIV